MYIKYSPINGLAVIFEPQESREAVLFLRTMANGFSQMENAKELSDKLTHIVRYVEQQENQVLN